MATTPQVAAQNDTIVIKGYVKDTLNGEAMPFTFIRLDNFINYKYSTQTNCDGFFKIKISNTDLSNKAHKLLFGFSSYEIKPKTISIQTANDTIIVYGQLGL